MMFGFVVPALVQELSLLKECVDNIRSASRTLPSISPRIAVVLQGELDEVPEWLATDPVIDLQLLPSKGVSYARNVGLARLENCSDLLMFVDVSVRPSADFLRGAVLALSTASVVSAPVAFDDQNTVLSGDATLVTRISAARIAFRAFIWSTAFRTSAIAGLRFDETIGPGTMSPHQAGEDGRFLHLAIMRHKLKEVHWLPYAPVRRLPRPDLKEKIKRYAYGQGALLGQQVCAPGWSFVDRVYFIWRVALFFANTARIFFLSPDGRAISRGRLSGLLSGMRIIKKDTLPIL
jgi:hypothetical protein